MFGGGFGGAVSRQASCRLIRHQGSHLQNHSKPLALGDNELMISRQPLSKVSYSTLVIDYLVARVPYIIFILLVHCARAPAGESCQISRH